MKKFLVPLVAFVGLAFVVPEAAQAGPRVAVAVGVPLPGPGRVVVAGPCGPYYRGPVVFPARRWFRGPRVFVRGGYRPYARARFVARPVRRCYR